MPQLLPEESMDFCGLCEVFAPTLFVGLKGGAKPLCEGCQDRELVIACERCVFVGSYEMMAAGVLTDEGYFCEPCADELRLYEEEQDSE